MFLKTHLNTVELNVRTPQTIEIHAVTNAEANKGDIAYIRLQEALWKLSSPVIIL